MTREEVIKNYALQVTAKNLKNEIADLQDKHTASKDRSEKIQITKKIKVLKAELDSMPEMKNVHLMDAPQYILEMETLFKKYISEYEDLKDKMLTALANDSLTFFLEWRIEEIAPAEMLAKTSKRMLDIVNEDFPEVNYDKAVAWNAEFNRLLESWTSRCMQDLSGGLSTWSGAGGRNLIENSVTIAKAKFVDNHTSWSQHQFYFEAVQNQQILIEEEMV